MSFFLTVWKVQLVINRHDNKKREIEIGIPQRFPVLSIFFLIYISGIFDKVAKTSLLITSLFFINNLGFIAFASLIKNVVKAFEKIAKIILE